MEDRPIESLLYVVSLSTCHVICVRIYLHVRSRRLHGETGSIRHGTIYESKALSFWTKTDIFNLLVSPEVRL